MIDRDTMNTRDTATTRRLHQALDAAQPDVVAVARLLGEAKRAPTSDSFVRSARMLVVHGRRILDTLDAALGAELPS